MQRYTDMIIEQGEDAVRKELQRLQTKILKATRKLEQGYAQDALKVLRG